MLRKDYANILTANSILVCNLGLHRVADTLTATRYPVFCLFDPTPEDH